MRFLKKANNGIQIVQYEIRDYVIIAIFIDFQILQFFAQFQQNSKLFWLTIYKMAHSMY